jgi:hypothetical protein
VDTKEFRNGGKEEEDDLASGLLLWHLDFRAMASVIVPPCLLDKRSLQPSSEKTFFLLEDDRDLCWFHGDGQGIVL